MDNKKTKPPKAPASPKATKSPRPRSDKRDTLRRLVLSAMFLAIGLILPFFTGHIQQIGNMILPMHIPVLLCGLVCGWQYGGAVGLLLPLIRSLLFTMPPLYPTAVAMAAELCVYGLVIGAIYGRIRKQNPLTVYLALIPAMLAGRLVWGGAMLLLLRLEGSAFTAAAFLSGAVLNAIPGIIIQLILIPAVMSTLHITGLSRFRSVSATEVSP